MEVLPLQSRDRTGGRLYIVSTGPGDLQQMTPRALKALAEADSVIGNAFYLDLVEPLLAGKEVITSSMGREVERAKKALERAEHETVAMVSGGDAGVYGMASIVLEVVERSGSSVPVEVVPGVTAALSAASRLGSPLSGDFVTLSLSDLLTPWEVIEERLDLAFRMGVPVALYNPRSNGRPENLAKAVAIARRHATPTTPVGVVKNAFRKGEEILVTTLEAFEDRLDFVDMRSIAIVGGEESRLWRRDADVRGIITPRGYHRKYVY
ncbi:precorrin-3B C(17)-methyltransferase [Methanoculleus sp. FWC-SCC1]|uniref:Precorrin-3B C(17)-methyltransferase n=1 Tax=Methanoculleus frigidifontis TaxID=2584085 RepID=A0ABT8MB20_9EURY|nr:precorrin-3B C(17)-methyltransferase [Methanoculleus sp. FWC-SCC1]MDN7025138.1 precorrin-3B C(17)-methyltransferase [Methanoculleus sp. FWC-SCC1]